VGFGAARRSAPATQRGCTAGPEPRGSGGDPDPRQRGCTAGSDEQSRGGLGAAIPIRASADPRRCFDEQSHGLRRGAPIRASAGIVVVFGKSLRTDHHSR